MKNQTEKYHPLCVIDFWYIVSTRWYTHAHTPRSENAFVHAEFLSAANQNHVGEFAVIQSRREIRKKVFIDGRNRQIGRGSRLRVRFLDEI